MPEANPIMIGSRGSKLALWQANWVKTKLAEAGHPAKIAIIKTAGDKMVDVPLAQSGVKGLFIKEIEESLISGEVDVAVHSLKDLPNDQPEGLYVAAVPERADARDILISKIAKTLADLPPGARVATSSLRRQSQLARLRPDLQFVPVRGNIDTRLKKLDGGDFDALVLAAAGVQRLGLQTGIVQYFSVDQVCPAVGQGALAIEIRKEDKRMEAMVAPLNHAASHTAVLAERAVLKRLGGGCQLPIAAHALPESECLRLHGVVASPDGKHLVRTAASGSFDDPEQLGASVADSLLKLGAREIIQSFESGR